MDIKDLNTNLFFIAIRDNYTFPTTKGNLTLHDLFRIPVPIKESANNQNNVSLDDIAKDLDQQIEKKAGKSFVRTSRKTNDEIVLRNKLDIVKLIIEYRISEFEQKIDATKAKEAAERKREMIEELIAKKQFNDLDKLSLDELEKLKATI